MLEVTITLPDDVAAEAKEAGLFKPLLAASIFREELRKRKRYRFFQSIDKLAALDGEPMTEEEIQAEIDAARAERRNRQ